MAKYKYDNPDDAYEEALRRIQRAKDRSQDFLQLNELGLTSVPPEIGELAELKTLFLEDNKLASVPPEIGYLTKLNKLYLQNNQLTTLPPEIGLLKDLRVLCLGSVHLGMRGGHYAWG